MAFVYVPSEWGITFVDDELETLRQLQITAETVALLALHNQ